MNIKYLNLAQAKAISNDYLHLIGRNFYAGELTEILVQTIVPAPYSRILQWQFVRLLLRGAPLEEALSICPNGRYDVLVFPNIPKQTHPQFAVKSIREYLEEHNLPFVFDHYLGLRAVK